MARTWYRLTAALAMVPLLLVAGGGPAQAVVGVSRAEVSGDRLRIEGTAAPSRAITVDGVQMATSGSGGTFRIERSGYTRPADCTVDVNDGSATATSVRLSGCTVTAAPQPAALSSITLSPSSLQGGGAATATVTLTAGAPAEGAVVALATSSTAAVVPTSVTVPAGIRSVSASVTTSAVSTTTPVTVTATYASAARSATLTLTPPPAPGSASLTALTLSPATVQTGTTSTSATLSFSDLTPTGGARVTLASSAAFASVPAEVTIPANSSTGAFSVAIASSAAGTATISATYAGVTRSAVLTVSAQSSFRITTPSPLPNARVGENYAGFIEACCGQGTPYRWSLVGGTVPDGLRFAGDSLRLSRTTGVTGVATRVQTTTFTVRARDGAGNTATATFTLTVDPANPLTVNNQGATLTGGRVGVAYETGLFALGGVQPYPWSHAGGVLPPGLAVQASPGRVLGTPTAAGTFVFTARVDDSSGQSATREFTLTVTG